MTALVLVGIPIAVAGAFMLLRPAATHDWNERGSVKLAKAMGISDRTVKPMGSEKFWIMAAGLIILATGIFLVVAGAMG